MEKVLRLLPQEDSNVHIVSPKFLPMMQSENEDGWNTCKRLFRPTEREDAGTLRPRDLAKPSQRAPVLIIPVHSGSGKSAHWNPLIRDARGVGIEKARWRFFDTAAGGTREANVQKIIKSTELWQEGMIWETVDTPQQDPRNMDCGALTNVIPVSYVRWSAKVDHARLNTGRLQLKNKESAVKMGIEARRLHSKSSNRTQNFHPPIMQGYAASDSRSSRRHQLHKRLLLPMMAPMMMFF